MTYDPEKDRTAQRRYKERHPERVKARKLRFYQENAERLREERKAYYYANREVSLATASKSKKRLYEGRKAAGLCVTCGLPAAPGVTKCQTHREASNAAMRSKQPYRRYRYKTLYGLDLDALADLLTSQENRCAICREPFDPTNKAKKMAIDHNHETGAVRGALCRNCNVGLGQFGDDPHMLENAVKYLRAARAVRLEVVS